ncbi:MAG: acyl--CoA ligase [Ruminococcaceae bacterium]|nr:acyl--CoA ligase [Oscillospiraceae bacterium]
MEIKAPWLKYYTDIKPSLEYPEYTLYEAVLSAAKKSPESIALIYMGTSFTYKDMIERIYKVRVALEKLGVKQGDRIMVCLPNIPQAVYLLYAADSMGAVVSFIHPLSAVGEYAKYLELLEAEVIITLDIFYPKFLKVFEKTGEKKLILTGAADELGILKQKIYRFSQKKKQIDFFEASNVYLWKKLLKEAVAQHPKENIKSCDDVSVVLFSGGTTGEPKGVMLSAKGLNAMAMQTIEMSHCDVRGKLMLAAMPMFHGFGLGVCVHTALLGGAACILVPRFTVREYAKLIKKYRPNFIAGVPTLFEALLREEEFSKTDLSCLSGVFSGGDTLPPKLKSEFDGFLKDHGAAVRIREGYGATECVTASCLTPYNVEREGSIGIPFPDTFYKICEIGSSRELPFGKEGEICIHGPAIMKGYLGDPQETEKVLKVHEDGLVWLHTGDVGLIDEDGFVYFKSRIKRVIVTRGYNVYPANIERILEENPLVKKSCVVGVSDSYKMQSIKAYIVLYSDRQDKEKLKEEILDYCKMHIAKFAIPSFVEFVNALPVTKAGKIDYRALEAEANKETK